MWLDSVFLKQCMLKWVWWFITEVSRVSQHFCQALCSNNLPQSALLIPSSTSYTTSSSYLTAMGPPTDSHCAAKQSKSAPCDTPWSVNRGRTWQKERRDASSQLTEAISAVQQHRGTGQRKTNERGPLLEYVTTGLPLWPSYSSVSCTATHFSSWFLYNQKGKAKKNQHNLPTARAGSDIIPLICS